jgi:hypothetical protein
MRISARLIEREQVGGGSTHEQNDWPDVGEICFDNREPEFVSSSSDISQAA